MTASPAARKRRRIAWIALALVVAGCLVVGFGSPPPKTDEDRARAIERTIKCPICRSQSVETSDTAVSGDIRDLILVKVRSGESANAIRNEIAAKYGQDVLLNPPTSGVAGLVWVIPVAGAIVAAAGLVFVFRRWSRDPARHATEADRKLVAEALGEADADGDGDGETDGDES